MEFLLELLFDLITEGTVELSQNVKVPKIIRYPLIVIIVIFFVAVIGVMVLASVLALRQNLPFGILLSALTLFLLVTGVLKFRKIYLSKK